jgi:hypothetical protein
MGAPRAAPRAGLRANLALAAASLLLALGTLEIAARALLARPAEPIASQYTEFDPLLGWRHKRGARARFPQGDYFINGVGLRDRERSYQAPPGTFRLLALGDSFAEGFSVALEDSVAQVLERSLARADCPVEVIAAGTVGYSTDQEYLYYREEGQRFAAQVVVLFFYYNDIVYNARESVGPAPKPLLTFKGGVPKLKTSPLAAPPSAQQQARGLAAPGGSVAWAWARERLLSGAPRAYDALAALGLFARREPLRAGAELLVYSRKPPREVEDAWAQTVNVLRALRDETGERGARLIVVYVPSKMEVLERDWELTRARYGVDDANWDRRRVARGLLEAGRALGLAVLDLTEALRRQERGPARSTYHAQGGHWNRLGHATAALELESALRREALLPDCAKR